METGLSRCTLGAPYLLALEHRDWVLLIDDRRPFLAAARRGLKVLCTPVLVVKLYSPGKMDALQALGVLARLSAMQTVSPDLLSPAVTYLQAAWQQGGRE